MPGNSPALVSPDRLAGGVVFSQVDVSYVAGLNGAAGAAEGAWTTASGTSADGEAA